MKIPNTPFSTRLSGSAKETELRLRSIFQWKKKRPPVILFILTVVALFACFGLVSCEQEKPLTEEAPMAGITPEVETTPEADDPENIETFEEQLRLIADCVETWAVPAEYANERYAYCVTDLDGNGQLELIAANYGGTGHYTYSRFYQVDRDCTALVPCDYATNFPHDAQSEADIIDYTVDAYRSSNGLIWYIFDDYGKWGGAEYPEVKLWLHLSSEGLVDTIALAWKHSVFTEDGILDYTTCADWLGTEWSDAESEGAQTLYNTAADRYFADCQKLSVTFGWLDMSPEEVQRTDRETLSVLLNDSYRKFTVTEQTVQSAANELPVYNMVDKNRNIENAQERLTAAQRNLLADLPADLLPKEAVELGTPFRSDFWRDTLIPLAHDRKYDVTLYGVVGNVPDIADEIAVLNQELVTDGIVLRAGERAAYFPADWDGNNWHGQNPWMVVDDFTGDGRPEAAVCLHWERGTGVHLESLSFIDLENLSSMAAVDCTSLEVTARYDDVSHTVVLSSGELDSVVHLIQDVDPVEELSFGRDYITYFYEDGQFFCSMPLSVSTISYIAEVTAPVVWIENGYRLGEAVSLTEY